MSYTQREIDQIIIKRLLRIAWDRNYNISQIETLKMELETNLRYYLEKCDDDIQIINEALH